MMMSSSSSGSATVRVDKATSDLLIGPDWTMNIEICDSINSNPWQAKEVVKAVKKRLQHKNPKVHLLALTLLETMVKNCGDYVHIQIVERNILQEMVKIVRKKADMQVRDTILILLDSWQEAFGGPAGKHPQYYWVYEELRRSGVEFPQRSLDASPIFTPPVTHLVARHAQPGYGMPSNASIRLDEAMASESETFNVSSLDSMQSIMELLCDMLQAVNPHDHKAVKDEVINDLVTQCRANQKRLMQMLTSTGDEDILGRGLELNDSLQSLLAKHDAIASGMPQPVPVMDSSPQPKAGSVSSLRSNEVRESNLRPNTSSVVPIFSGISRHVEDENEEDEFTQLARRHFKQKSVPSKIASSGTGEGSFSSSTGNYSAAPEPACLVPSPNNVLALTDSPAPVQTTKEQDMIELLNITLSTTTTSAHSPYSSDSTSVAAQNTQEMPVSPETHGKNPYSFPGNHLGLPFDSYVAPWARPLPQLQPQQPQPQHHRPVLPPLQLQRHPGTQQQLQMPQLEPSLQTQNAQYGYPPPPWAATPGYSNIRTSYAPASSYVPMQRTRPLQHYSSFPSKGSNRTSMDGDVQISSNPRIPAPAAGQKPFVPSYRLFEDLNVLGSSDGRSKVTNSPSSSLAGSSGQSMVGGKK